MEDLNTLSYFLGLEVSSNDDDYCLNQAKYSFDLFSNAVAVVSTPVELHAQLTHFDRTTWWSYHYRQLADSLIYFIVTRPDLSAIHLVIQSI